MSALCYSVSALCYSVSALCYSVSALCYSVSALCYSVSALCYSVSALCYSVSALQWLCNADKKEHHPHKRLYKFFTSLFACLVSVLKVQLSPTYIYFIGST